MSAEPLSSPVTLDFGEIVTRTAPPVSTEEGCQLLDALVAYFRKYVRVGEDEYTVLASWVLHCHAFQASTRTPYLNVTSPAPGCGKTQLLEATELVVPEPMMTSSCTNAVLARSIDQDHPVLLIDEFDQLQAGDKELLAGIMATVNSGYKKSGNRIILEPVKGGGWQRRRLSTFCPKILSGISSLPAITKSRCIPIHMERLRPGESVADIDEYIIEPEAAKLKLLAQAWASQHMDVLAQARPDSPLALHNRQREVSRPLFAVADTAGGNWPERVRSAVVRLFAAVNATPGDDIKMELLADIRDAFGSQERLASVDLVKSLTDMEDRPWATWSKGKGINPHQLSRLLKDFRTEDGSAVSPRNLRLKDGRQLKGYEREWFTAIWDRYLPHTDIQTVPPLQSAKTLDKTQFSNRTRKVDGTDAKSAPDPRKHCIGTGGTVQHLPRPLPSCSKCGSFAVGTDPAECFTCGGAS